MVIPLTHVTVPPLSQSYASPPYFPEKLVIVIVPPVLALTLQSDPPKLAQVLGKTCLSRVLVRLVASSRTSPTAACPFHVPPLPPQRTLSRAVTVTLAPTTNPVLFR